MDMTWQSAEYDSWFVPYHQEVLRAHQSHFCLRAIAEDRGFQSDVSDIQTETVHPLYGPPVNIFTPKDSSKYWIRASTLVLGYFLFLVLDKVVCPFLVKYFDMPIWHPISEKTLEELLHAKADL
jgi:hypothetical protein